MNYAISGGTGFIGRRIVTRLLEGGHSVAILGRAPPRDNRAGIRSFLWDPMRGEPPAESLDGADAVIHLAGEPVAQRWNEEIKRRIRDSRVLGTRRLVDAIGRAARSSAKRPRVLVSALAVGFCGDRGDEAITESSPPGAGFLSDVCREWEAEADRAADFGVRVAKLRVGFVLGKDGGAMAQLVPVFRAFAGGRLGSGRQWMPWIHLADVAEMFIHAAENAASGVWNATAPNPVRNAEFTREMASVLHRPALFAVPRFALRLAFGEIGPRMLDSARAVPDAALRAGFRFQYPELAPALHNLLD